MNSEARKCFRLVQKGRYFGETAVLDDGKAFATLSFGVPLKVGAIKCGAELYEVVQAGVFSKGLRLFHNGSVLTETPIDVATGTFILNGSRYLFRHPKLLRDGVEVGFVEWKWLNPEAEAEFAIDVHIVACLFAMWLSTRSRIDQIANPPG